MTGRRAVGIAAIALGVGFNVPYAILATIFDYPQVLRQPAEFVLERFAARGPALIVTWYAFMLCALALLPVSAGLAISRDRLERYPALVLAAAAAGACAGVLQAVGFSRWVFVVPLLARRNSNPNVGASFDLLNAYGGVAIGEHLGQLLTALFMAAVALMQRDEGARATASVGMISALAIATGTGEGIAIAIGLDGSPFGFVTIAGFLGLSAWLVMSGAAMLRSARTPPPATG